MGVARLIAVRWNWIYGWLPCRSQRQCSSLLKKIGLPLHYQLLKLRGVLCNKTRRLVTILIFGSARRSFLKVVILDSGRSCWTLPAKQVLIWINSTDCSTAAMLVRLFSRKDGWVESFTKFGVHRP